MIEQALKALSNAQSTDDWLTLVATYASLLGFSALGAAGLCWEVIRLVMRKANRLRDQRYFGDKYFSILRQAQNDGSYDKRQIKSLRNTLSKKRQKISERVRQKLSEELELDRQKLAPGSSTLTYAKLLSGPPLLMPCAMRTMDGQKYKSTPDFLLDLRTVLTNTLNRKSIDRQILLLGTAGIGKSLLCMQAQKVVDEFSKDLELSCVRLTASDFAYRTVASPEVGTLEWCAELLANRHVYRGDRPSALEIRLLTEVISDEVVFIVDALDEAAQSLSVAELDTLLSSWLFERAVVVSSRESFFRARLQGAPALKSYMPVLLDAPSDGVRRSFLRGICGRGADADARFDRAQSMLASLPALGEIARTPLLLLMLAEFAVEDIPHDDATDLVGIYERFVSCVVESEVRRSNGEITASSLKNTFEDLAWLAFTGRAEHERASLIDRGALKDVLQLRLGAVPVATLERVEEAVTTSALISSLPDHPSMAPRPTAFVHETFLEFLVATMLNDWLIGLRSDGHKVFRFLETRGISFFIKEYVRRLREAPVGSANARERLWALYDQLRRETRTATDEKSARLASFTAGQVVYYLGHLSEDADRKRLAKIAYQEKDFWIRRAAAIGLAFCDDAAPYHALIDEMRRGMDVGDFTLCRKHIAMELGFYGDQEFDRRDPGLDRGGSACRRLVTAVTTQSQLAVEEPNWRLDLFDLVYLSRFRNVSSKEFRIVLSEMCPSLQRSLDRLGEAPDAPKYPEIGEVRALIASIEDHSERPS